MFSIYTRYTSYSLCPNNTLISQGYLFVSFNYRSFLMVEVNGFEPMTPSLQS